VEPAAAQTRAELNKKIEALEKQLRAVQRQVFDQDSPYFQDREENRATPRVETPGPADGGPRSTLLADLTVRVEEISSQVSTLTGRIEELRHENRQLKRRLERFEQDAASRLRDLEQGRHASAAESREDGPDVVPAPHITDSTEDEPALDGGQRELAASGDEATPSEPASVQEQYDQAYSLLRRGQMEEAEEAFRAFVERNGDHELAANAQYWLGESFYVRESYPRAAQAFLTAYQDYPESSKAADSLLKLGMTLAALDQTEDACAAFDELDSQFGELEDRIARRMRQERGRLGCE